MLNFFPLALRISAQGLRWKKSTLSTLNIIQCITSYLKMPKPNCALYYAFHGWVSSILDSRRRLSLDISSQLDHVTADVSTAPFGEEISRKYAEILDALPKKPTKLPVQNDGQRTSLGYRNFV